MSEKSGDAKDPFDGLLDDVAGLAKAFPAADDKADEKIAEAEAEGEENSDAAADGTASDEKSDDNKGEGLTKAFTVTLEDGTEVPAIDAADLIKSLSDRLDASETNGSKMLTAVQGLVSQVGVYGDLVKSLQDKVTALSSEGRGRKAVVTIAERPAPAAAELAKSESATGGVSSEQFMAKALDLCGQGKLTASDIAQAEAAINLGIQPLQHIVAAVAASMSAPK